MVGRAMGTALLLAGLTAAAPAGAQGFSAGGSAGVAQARGLTASPGVHGVAAGDGPSADGPEPRAFYGAREMEVDDAPRDGLDAGARIPRRR